MEGAEAQESEADVRMGYREGRAMSAFSDSLSLTIVDPAHSRGEQRSHTERGETVRIISARRASGREKRAYAEGED